MTHQLKALIHLEADLASVIALRYACRLAQTAGMGLQALHVARARESEPSPPGTGWVRQTWEGAVTEQDRDKIARLVREQKAGCPGLGNPKIVRGRPEVEILHELQAAGYDLFCEGILHAFEPTAFVERLTSSLYRNLPCPALVVKNQVRLEKGIALLGQGEDLEVCRAVFSRLLGGLRPEVDILAGRFEGTAAVRAAAPDGALEAAEREIAAGGGRLRRRRELEGSPQAMAAATRDYGLVVAALPRETAAGHPMLELLSRCPVPVLIGWR